ncbi:jg16666 [Pararge aegeria aegeria]|uniref:Jg16666 protein n=1 Tax=Pararge aegeria aegeria TaxID=348720 RepID=A0A8S4RAN2_9NEOP|nr:jg16666 [Pararge aegeria aegeria]
MRILDRQRGSQKTSRSIRDVRLSTNAENQLNSKGHVLQQQIMMGRVAGKARIGCKRKSWLRNIREWTRIASAAQLFNLARQKESYQKLTTNLH